MKQPLAIHFHKLKPNSLKNRLLEILFERLSFLHAQIVREHDPHVLGAGQAQSSKCALTTVQYFRQYYLYTVAGLAKFIHS